MIIVLVGSQKSIVKHPKYLCQMVDFCIYAWDFQAGMQAHNVSVHAHCVQDLMQTAGVAQAVYVPGPTALMLL